MVGHQVLVLVTGVRVPVSEHERKTLTKMWVFFDLSRQIGGMDFMYNSLGFVQIAGSAQFKPNLGYGSSLGLTFI